MARWEPDARGRLQQAALELYDEHGYEATTAAQIAARAGLTERTFFRHFPDKREVLFGNETAVQAALVEGVAGAPASATPREAVAAGLAAAARQMQPRRALLRRHASVVAAHPDLRERELAKQAAMAAAVADALRERGVDDSTAGVVGEVAIGLLRVSSERWTAAGEKRSFEVLVLDALAQLVAFAS
jgi:AcrR family transcriptional regulator